jgi:hypothetical protein
MQTAEYNHEDFANQSKADEGLMVRFYYKSIEDTAESQAQGRPVFKEKTYIEIRVAGQRDVQAARPVTFADKQRFPRHYEAFEKRVEPPTEGMPLAEWPAITRTQAEEMAFMNVKTVEQLATMKDSNLSKFMNGYKLRDQAVKWLDFNQNATEDAEKADLKNTVAELQAQVTELMVALEPTTQAKVEKLYAEAEVEPVEVAEIVDVEVNEGAAVAVPAAPAGIPKRKSRRSK